MKLFIVFMGEENVDDAFLEAFIVEQNAIDYLKYLKAKKDIYHYYILKIITKD